MFLLGIDVGSTSIKAVLYDENLRVVSTGQVATPLTVDKSETDNAELFWKPDEIWQGVVTSVKEAVSGIPNPAVIGGVAVDGFGQDAVPLSRDGSCLYPFISWHDKKTTPQMERFLQNVTEEEVYRITGTRPWYFHTIFRIMWLNSHHPEIVRNTWKFLIITDYVNYRLCGAVATDFSEASTTMAFDQNSSGWSETLLAIAGIDGSVMPEPRQSGTRIGEVTAQAAALTGLKAGTPVILGGHDNICSFLAARDMHHPVPVIITGTFESVLVSSPKLLLGEKGMRRNIVCEKSVTSGEYVLWGAQHAGNTVEWFDERFGFDRQKGDGVTFSLSDRLCMLRKEDAGARGVFMLPHLLGGMTPVADPRSRGAFIGLTEETTKTDLLRAIIEGINYQTRSICESLSVVTGRSFTKAINIGGAACSGFWMQNRADITGMVIEVPDIREATSLGAAILAGVGVGMFDDYAEALSRRMFEVKTYTPDEQRSKSYDRYYMQIFRKLYESMKELNHTIHNEFC